MSLNKAVLTLFLFALNASAEQIQIDAVGEFDSDPSGILAGDLSYSISVAYDTVQDPFSTIVSDGCCPDPTKPTTTTQFRIISFSLTVAGQTVSLDDSFTPGSNGINITDSTSPTSDGVSFLGNAITTLLLNSVEESVTIDVRLGAFGLGTAFSEIDLSGISDVYTTVLFNQDLRVEINSDLLQDADENTQNGTFISFRKPPMFALKQTLISSQAGFGVPVALDGGTALIGAPGVPGSASLLNIPNGDVVQTFDNPNPTTSGAVATDFYAHHSKKTIAVSSGRILIGAESEDLAATDSGAAYLFDASTGAVLQTFTHPNPIPDFGGVGFGQGFGREVALIGDFALVASVAREAFLFDAMSGNLLRSFAGSAGLFGFGESVALSQQYVAIGDSTNNTGASRAGAVHLFDKDTGSLLWTFFNPSPEAFDFFGEEIAVDGNRVLIGAGQVDVSSVSNAGEAYLFDATTGQLLHTFVDPGGNENAFFGRHLDIEGDVIAIGAHNDSEVHVFDAVSGDFLQTITEQSAPTGFGTSVDLDQGNLLVGMPFGKAYLYGIDCKSVTDVSQVECQALVALYDSAGGFGWTNQAGWLSDPKVCNWFGVTCTGNKVTELNLEFSGLTGGIPVELGNLINLQRLFLNNNQLSGSIPAELGNLVNLQWLLLNKNQLSDPIPVEIGSLGNLQYLFLKSNQLTGSIPVELGNLNNLIWLFLEDNLLNGSVPTELGNMTNLEYLYLDGNQLSGSIPAELGNLANLQRLHLNDNQLNGSIPFQLGNLGSLRWLLLEGNQLSGPIPAELGGLTGLTRFFVFGNALTGEVPNALTALTSLQEIDFSHNALYTNNGPLDVFLDNQSGFDWSITQTIAPDNVLVEPSGGESVTVNWDPIEFTNETGRYRVGYSQNPGGPYTDAGTTADKLATSHFVDGLAPGISYYFTVRTETDPHLSNLNLVISEPSTESTVIPEFINAETSFSTSSDMLIRIPLWIRLLPNCSSMTASMQARMRSCSQRMRTSAPSKL